MELWNYGIAGLRDCCVRPLVCRMSRVECRIRKVGDWGIMELWNYGIAELRNRGIVGLRDSGMAGLRDCGIAGLKMG